MNSTNRLRLLVDTNLLVLFTVGSVNRRRIGSFKRTRNYSEADFDLLLRHLGHASGLYTLAHILAEVSNLTDLSGNERGAARAFLRDVIGTIIEPVLPSMRAAQDIDYLPLGLTDAAIASAAVEHKCTVLTDDLDLFRSLLTRQISAINLSHLREQAMGV
jgi:predicted nucleic acid-binding protein